jgi:hypothetical protein
MLAREIDETQVPRMQIAHGRHEGDVFVIMTPAFVQLAHFVQRIHQFHR